MEFLERVVNALVNLHPWHTLLVHFPSAFATVGAMCILFARWRGSELAEKFAYFCITVTAAGTAMAGRPNGVNGRRSRKNQVSGTTTASTSSFHSGAARSKRSR